MALSLGDQTREAGRAAAKSLSVADLDIVDRARASTNAQSGERDRLLCEIIYLYRIGHRDVWSAVLLDLMAPAILKRLGRYRIELPTIDAEDVRQQYVLELLELAANMPMPAGARFVERRLVLRAGQGVRRWLRREHHHLARIESFDKSLEQQEVSDEA